MRGHDEPSSGNAVPFDSGREFFEGMVAAASDAVLTTDADGTVVYANEAVECLLGYAPERMRGRQFTEFVPERFRDRYDGWFDHYAEGDSGTPLDDETFEQTWLCADGEEVRLSVSAFEHESDGRRLFSGFVREAPERSTAGERLREEEALIEEIFDTSPVAFAVRNADGELLRANERASELAGVGSGQLPYDADEAEWDRRTVYDARGEPLSRDELPVARVFETGDPVTNEEVIVERPDGKQIHLSVSAAPVYDDGEVERVVSAAEDITELKAVQFELERQREELETELSEMFSRVTDAFFALNDDWEFTYLNDEAEELLMRREESLLGENLWKAFPEAADSTFQREYERAMETQEPVSFVEYYPPFSTWFEVRAYPSETGLSVYFQDVTERKERELELERYETIIETVEDGVYALDSEERFVMVNDAFLEMTGYDREELLGRHASVVHSEEINETAARMSEEVATEMGSATLEFEVRTRDGETIPVESRFGPYRYGDEAFARTGIVRDITERKEYERELEAQNERLDAFASMLAHELRNPLEIAQIYLDMGVQNVAGDPAFEEVERALDRIEEMIDTLLVVTRRGGTVDSTEAVALGEAAEEWWESVEPDGSLAVETDRRIRADPSRLRQLLENLYRNAVEHAGEGVTVRVGDLPGGFYVEDDGPGIPEDERGQVFEPGYSTSNVGIGFGLAVVSQLVDAHDWHCEITESESGGARFEFTGVDVVDE